MTPNQLKNIKRYPTAMDLREKARRRLPRFAFEFMDGGAGEDGGIMRNWRSLDAVELMPRYGKTVFPPPTNTKLFGREYSAPFGISPVGSPGTVFPGAENFLARAAQAANIPYTMGLLSAITIEQAMTLAHDVLWLQMFRFANNDHQIGFDIVRRAEAAGVHALVLTCDTPVRTRRPREVRSGISNPFRMTNRLRLDALMAPFWLLALLRQKTPRFVNLQPYMNRLATPETVSKFMQAEGQGAFTWEEMARYRDKWQRQLIIKGVQHPEDAEQAVKLGFDGIMVTNHGGRQIEALPSTIDCLPDIADVVGDKAALILDSGIRSGVDVARSVALGAQMAFAGKAFLWSLGAMGGEGPSHLIQLVQEELSSTLGQLGCDAVEDLHSVSVRHEGRWYSRTGSQAL